MGSGGREPVGPGFDFRVADLCWTLFFKALEIREALPALSAEAAARSAGARLQSNVRARCLDALAASLVVVLVLLGASSSSPLAVFAAIFALLLRLPCLQLWLLSLACSACKLSSFARFPFLDSQVFYLTSENHRFPSQLQRVVPRWPPGVFKIHTQLYHV